MRTLLYRATFVAALIMSGLLAYLPGTHGPFLFDDWASLPSLGADGSLQDRASLLRYLTSGTADPTGRPLSLISFVLNAQDWPAPAWSFKFTNVAIHIANSLLLAVLLTTLTRHTNMRAERVKATAWFAAALWALHPFLVSTVLYVVQRETLLAATFAFLALIAWLCSREAFAASRPRAAGWLYGAAGAATFCAVLCKANGVVIPLLALAIDTTLPPLQGEAALRYRRHARVALVLPSALLLATLAWLALSSIGQPPIPVRGWTIGERLMTEPSVLLDYLSRLWLIRPASGAFFHDQLTVTTSLFHPWYAGAPLLACGLIVALAVGLRKRAPLVAAAALFFFAGHALESTSVPLELYFEHRNYLPAALMFWPLSAAIINARYDWLRFGLPPVLLAGLFWLTRSQATLWGDPLEQAIVWARLQPDSPRAQAYAASVLAASGHLDEARQRIDSARQHFPHEPQVAINLINIHCATGGLASKDLAYASQAFGKAPRDPGALMTHWFEGAIANLPHPPCRQLDATALRALLAAAQDNPRVAELPGRRQDITHLYGAIALAEGDAETAARLFAAALAEDPTPKVALNEAALLGTAGRPDLGLSHLAWLDSLPHGPRPSLRDGMAWVHGQVLEQQHYWPNEIAHLRSALQTASTHSTPGPSQ